MLSDIGLCRLWKHLPADDMRSPRHCGEPNQPNTSRARAKFVCKTVDIGALRLPHICYGIHMLVYPFRMQNISLGCSKYGHGRTRNGCKRMTLNSIGVLRENSKYTGLSYIH